jgi:hypothetical protein
MTTALIAKPAQIDLYCLRGVPAKFDALALQAFLKRQM